MRVGFVGAGRMGRPMVERLVGAGHEVRALGRTAEARAALAGIGARPAATLAAAVADAEAVIVCVFTDAQVREIAPGLPPRVPVVVHTTGSPSTVEELAGRGLPVIDAPVSGGPHDIAAGRLTVFLGGPGELADRVEPLIACYADPVLRVGPLGSGQRVKLVNNALFAAQIGLLAEAVRLGERLGVTEEVLLRALPHASSASRALTGVAARGSVAAFAATAGPFVGKDVRIAREVAAETGGGLGALDPLLGEG
ncbi:NAD(P)-dependent oxidoreductase [Actinocorallia longicatena]